jgi:hypothetical protein
MKEHPRRFDGADCRQERVDTNVGRRGIVDASSGPSHCVGGSHKPGPYARDSGMGNPGLNSGKTLRTHVSPSFSDPDLG